VPKADRPASAVGNSLIAPQIRLTECTGAPSAEWSDHFRPEADRRPDQMHLLRSDRKRANVAGTAISVTPIVGGHIRRAQVDGDSGEGLGTSWGSMLSKMIGGWTEFILRPTPSWASAAGGRSLVAGWSIVRFGQDDSLGELSRHGCHGTRKGQNLPQVSLSISSWLPVIFQCFTVPMRLISSATRARAPGCDFVTIAATSRQIDVISAS
jgi:hypothetical protein